MLEVFGRKTSINVQKVMWAVAELGLEHTRHDVGGPFGGTDTPEFAKRNPNRLVPVIDDNGFALWESHAIVRYLATKYGQGSLAPADAQFYATADQWMEWSNTTVYADIISTLFINYVRVPKVDRNQAVLDAAAKRAGSNLAVLDTHLAGRDYIMGDRLTIADLGAGTLMYRYFALPIERPAFAHLQAYYDRLRARPAYAAHVAIDFEAMKVPGA